MKKTVFLYAMLLVIALVVFSCEQEKPKREIMGYSEEQYKPDYPETGGPVEYIEVVVSQAIDVPLKLYLSQWEQAVNTFHSVNGKWPNDLEEVKNDPTAGVFVPSAQNIPEQYFVKYFPSTHEVKLMERKPVYKPQ